ncbi:MAG: hypothetical protein M3439_12470 [Chloroflexota bacterium]|nr:hypothetical protein [Chloroflexota bacterium]
MLLSGDRMIPPGDTRGNTRVRVAAALLSFVLAVVYMFQFASALERHAYLGGMFISIACLHVMYGAVLLIQPWTIDSIGRVRPDAAMHSRRWYRAGIGGNLALVVLLSLSLVGVLPSLNDAVAEILSIVFGMLLIASLVTLERRVRS